MLCVSDSEAADASPALQPSTPLQTTQSIEVLMLSGPFEGDPVRRVWSGQAPYEVTKRVVMYQAL